LCYDALRTKFGESRQEIIKCILHFEFGSNVVGVLTNDTGVLYRSDKIESLSFHENKLKTVVDIMYDYKMQIIHNWPHIPPLHIIKQCLSAYQNATCYSPPLSCACCACARTNVHLNQQFHAYLHILHPDDLHLKQVLHDDFQSDISYPSQVLNGLLLCKSAVQFRDSDQCTVIRICDDCYRPLMKNEMPQFALANHLYRGHLPKEFQDLTWIEEMCCAIYRTTAHVTRLYESTDIKQPFVYHGNTCAHEMNVMSMASVLPRTVADINSILTVVFIGHGKFNAKKLGNFFRVRKNKIWQFLLYLKKCNKLYSTITLDQSRILEYPDDDNLPDISESVIYDNTSDVNLLFEEETAGLTNHPASIQQNINDRQLYMLEKMGVSDPEQSSIPPRTLIALPSLYLY
jgi:Domain of unknown function (DUF6570)